jgi:hypothetical protein
LAAFAGLLCPRIDTLKNSGWYFAMMGLKYEDDGPDTRFTESDIP